MVPSTDGAFYFAEPTYCTNSRGSCAALSCFIFCRFGMKGPHGIGFTWPDALLTLLLMPAHYAAQVSLIHIAARHGWIAQFAWLQLDNRKIFTQTAKIIPQFIEIK